MTYDTRLKNFIVQECVHGCCHDTASAISQSNTTYNFTNRLSRTHNKKKKIIYLYQVTVYPSFEQRRLHRNKEYLSRNRFCRVSKLGDPHPRFERRITANIFVDNGKGLNLCVKRVARASTARDSPLSWLTLSSVAWRQIENNVSPPLFASRCQPFADRNPRNNGD